MPDATQSKGLSVNSPDRGFTLIEMMIVVVVIGVLAAIALPSYQEHVRKTRRAAATADLSDIAQRAERHHTVNNTYAGFDLPFEFSPQEGTAFYEIEISDVGQSTFTLTAAPINAQAGDAERCGTYTLSHTGRRQVSGPWGLERCW